jgi:hypothetical protein
MYITSSLPEFASVPALKKKMLKQVSDEAMFYIGKNFFYLLFFSFHRKLKKSIRLANLFLLGECGRGDG